MMTDPCTCPAVCPHNTVCGACHPSKPDGHWFPLCDTCCVPSATVYRLADGRYIGVITACGHAVVTERLPRAEFAQHTRSCTVADGQRVGGEPDA